MDQFTRSYLAAALWSSTGDDGNPLDSIYSVDDIPPGEVDKAERDCSAFRAAAGALLDGWPDEKAGHDFWLTRNGHGAGFWDRHVDGLPNGRELSTLVGFGTAFPPVDVYVGDDGLIYGF